jgi:AcrR family transcriptional regulator
MIGTVAERREAKKASIVAHAWSLAGEEGIGGISLRALAARAGMRQPSLYEYFDSKHDLYDAMFADANRQLVERLRTIDLPAEPRVALKVFMRAFVSFALEDQARLQLLFQRPIPGFEPSGASYALAEDVLAHAVALLHAAGVADPGDVDCFVAMVGGIIAAQASNEPNGDRWTRHLDRLIDLYLDNTTERTNR